MTTTTERRPRRRGWLIGLGVATVVLGGGLLATQLIGPGETPVAEPTPASPTTSATPAALVVEAGAGGTRVAEIDGLTPEGYPQTCEGAVAAATNLSAAFDYLPEGWSTVEGLARHAELVNYFARSGDNPDWAAGFKAARSSAALTDDGTFRSQILHPGTGAFRVISCTSDRAVVDVVVGGTTYTGEQNEPWLLYGSRRIEVTWFENDWVIRSIENLPVAELSTVQPPEGATEFTAQLRADLIASGPGWTEYSNAPA